MTNYAGSRLDDTITAATARGGLSHSILINQSNPSHLAAYKIADVITAATIKGGLAHSLYTTNPIQWQSWKIHKKLSMVY